MRRKPLIGRCLAQISVSSRNVSWGFNSRRLHHFFASLRENPCKLRNSASAGGRFYARVPPIFTLNLRQNLGLCCAFSHISLETPNNSRCHVLHVSSESSREIYRACYSRLGDYDYVEAQSCLLIIFARRLFGSFSGQNMRSENLDRWNFTSESDPDVRPVPASSVFRTWVLVAH